jgi:hypothetical protein
MPLAAPTLCSGTCPDTEVPSIQPHPFRHPQTVPGYETVRLYVSSTGTMQALNKLRELLAVTAPPNLSGDCRQIFTQMAEQLFDRLINL